MELSLPLSESEQEAVVGHCLTDFKFFLKCKKNLKKTWFTINPLIGVLFEQIVKVHNRDNLFIKSIKEFKEEFFFKELAPQERTRYYNLIDRCIHSCGEFTLERTKRKLTGFIRTSYFKESIEGAAKRYSLEGIDGAYEWTKKKIDEIKDASFEDNAFVMNFDDATTWVTESKKRREQAFSTGCKVLDQALGGGLFRGETLAFMAPSNTGKTRCMITLARNLIRQELHVLFFVHEGSPSMIRETILCSYLGITRQRLFQMIESNQESRDIVNSVSSIINQYLTFVPYIKTGGMYIEDVISMAKELNDELKNKRPDGKGYDVIMDDYPKKLKSRTASNSKEQLYRVVTADVYDQFNHLATELDCHVAVAVQTNRSGLRQNSGSVESTTVLGMEEVDEAFGIIQNLANVVTLNRSPEDKKADIIRLNVAKSRNDETDIVVNIRSCYKAAVLFGDRDMIDTGGLWETDIRYNVCVSYRQEDNKKIATGIIESALVVRETAIHGESTGAYTAQGEKAT
jgi:replicative DNA helicase